MWIKIFPLDPEMLDKEGKEEELAPVLLNLDRLLMVELNSDYHTLYIQEIESIIIRAKSRSSQNLRQAIRLMTGELTETPRAYLEITDDKERINDE